MGRNVFQSENPVGMLKALEAVVHNDATGAEAFELFQDSNVNRAT
jgi:putative autoinducer-2 (AI-2) aldolase